MLKHFGHIEVGSNFTKFFKFFRNNTPKDFRAFSRLSKNAKFFENTLSKPQGFFPTFLGTLQLVPNIANFFQNSFKMTMPMLPMAFSWLLLTIGGPNCFVDGYLDNKRAISNPKWDP